MTGIPPPRHAIVLDTPSGRGGDLLPGLQAGGYPGTAKPSQPDRTGLVCATAVMGRGNLR
jgi:hypothetical protein